MGLPPLLPLLKWLAVLSLLGGLLLGGHLLHEQMRGEREGEQNREKVESRSRARDGFVEFGVESAERYKLGEQPAQAVAWVERVPVYGRVVPNPQASGEIRSPFAGTVRAAGKVPWPGLGQRLEAGQVLGWVDVRVGPEVRVDLAIKLREARLKEKGAEEILKVQTSRVESLSRATERALLARSELDAAEVQLTEARTELAAARAAGELWQKAVEEVERHAGARPGKQPAEAVSPWSVPLTVPATGEVTELAVQPGTAIEAGGLVLQLVDPSRPLVRLDFPPELLGQGAPVRVQLTATPTAPQALRGVLNQPQVGAPPATVEGRRVGSAARLDATSQFAGYWYEVGPLRGRSNALWRPGLQVRALVEGPETKPQQAVAVPATAVLFHGGRALVYVRVEPGKYQRREVRLLGNEGERWLLAPREGLTGVAPGEAVVSEQAQLLLSEEFRGNAASGG